jgi:hypothetical protein
MLLYALPPVWVPVALLAYFFQERAAQLRVEMDRSEDSRTVRIARSCVHGLAVIALGLYAPFWGGALVAILTAMVGQGKSPNPSLPILPMSTYVLALSVVTFLSGVTLVDKIFDAIVSTPQADGARSLRVRDVLNLEVPDVALLFILTGLSWAWS